MKKVKGVFGFIVILLVVYIVCHIKKVPTEEYHIERYSEYIQHKPPKVIRMNKPNVVLAGIPIVNKGLDPKIELPSFFTHVLDQYHDRYCTVHHMLFDKKDNLWFSYTVVQDRRDKKPSADDLLYQGICCYDGRNFNTYTSEQGLPDNVTGCMAVDLSDNLWLGTGYGLCCFDGKNFTSYGRPQGLPHEGVSSIMVDTSGNLWLGTLNGLSYYDGKMFTNFDSNQCFKGYVKGILKDSKGNLWVGTFKGLSCFNGMEVSLYTDERGLASPCFPRDFSMSKCMMEDKKGNLWFITEEGGVTIYAGKKLSAFNADTVLAKYPISSIEEDKDGDIWFGSYNSIIRYDGKHFTPYIIPQSVSEDWVVSIIQNKNGNLLLGMTHTGILSFDGKIFSSFLQ